MNDLGREIPEVIGTRKLSPYRVPEKEKKKKLLDSLREAIKKVGLSDGDTISFHHHLRNGDAVVNMVLDAAAKMGIRDLRLAQTALFPVHEPVIEHIKNGVVTAIEGSINGPVGAFISRNAPLKEPVILRSHGGRARAVVEGELPVDVAFIAASECDPMGNCNGVNGPSAFGPMGFAYSDAWGADKVVIVTDNVVKYPAHPISISEIYVDYVVRVPSIGEPQGIASGTTKITTNPVRLEMARTVVDVIDKAGYIKEGFSFQAGAGGTSLAVVKFLHERMKEKGVVGDFAVGGVTEFVVNMLRDGTIRAIIDAQAFDLAAVESLRVDRNHIEVSHYHLMSPTVKSHVVMHQDACFLGATEVDVNFNVNVNTHSDGLLLHGIGGHQDAAAESKITIVVTPIVRKNIPIVREEVTTVSTPGDAVDVIVTDKGIAVNPRREDLMERLSGLNIVDIEDLQRMAYDITGGPPKVKWGDEIIALTQYRDGTYLDTIRSVRE